MRIGLFGGTFDPPHQAHLGASLLALKRLKLDRVWWLVTPGNPLKNTRGLAPLAKRIAAARKLTHHPRIDVTGLEAVINTRYTYDTIRWLIARCPRVRFVWIMGADNLRQLPPLAAMARYRETGADRGDRPPRPEPLRRGQSGGPGARPRPACRKTTPPPCRTASRRPGPSCTDSNRHYLRPRCARCASNGGTAAKSGKRKAAGKTSKNDKSVARSARNSYLDEAPERTGGGCNDTVKGQPSGHTCTLSESRRQIRRQSPVSRRPSAKETLRIVLARLDDMKAEDSVTIDLTGKSSIGDYMVVTTGRSNVHVASIADNLVKGLKAAAITGIRVEGLRQGDWVLIDAGDVIVHVFRPEVRDFYNLEKMWSAGRA